MHESVDVPLPPVIAVGFRMHERLVELGETVNVTVAENPFIGETVNAEVPAEPATASRSRCAEVITAARPEPRTKRMADSIFGPMLPGGN